MDEDVKFILDSTKESMEASIEHLQKALTKIRAGKASPIMLSTVMVDYYGSQTPLSQVSNINTPDARTLSVQPWEKNLLGEIETAIMNANLGFNPMNNGETIIINVPPLTEERRIQLAKQAKGEAEDAKVSIRSARQEANKELKELDISEDLLRNAEVDVQELTNKYIDRVDAILTAKEAEIMKVQNLDFDQLLSQEHSISFSTFAANKTQMVAKLTKGFWPKVASIILRNRILILLTVIGITVFLAMQWKNMQFSNTEANILPDDHPASIQYNAFTKIFGEEGNAIVLAIRDSALFTPKNFNRWNTLSKQLDAFPEVDYVISLENLKELIKDNETQTFSMEPLISHAPKTKQEIDSLTNHLFKELPFYDNLVYNPESGTIQTVVYLDKDIMNTAVRNEFILNDLAELVEDFEQETQMDVRISGMPYIRTWNTKSIIDEIGLFIVGALLVTSLIFFFFFRSFRATFISMCVVIIGVMWAFGILGLLRYEITILTALIPPLIIVIGIPNCIFLINKYQQEVKKHGNQALSLQRVISKIGNATLMTNITTASGFATFIILDSDLLKEFGIVASINIIGIFILSLLIIPIVYSFMSLPKTKHLKHLNKKWMDLFVNWMENIVRNHRIAVYITTVAVLVLSIIGIYQMRITGSRIEDLPKNSHFYKDIQFFEAEFDGIMPMEIVVDTKRKNGVVKPATLKRMDRLGTVIDEIPELSRPISIVDLVKYSKQAYYNGIPKYYQLPTSQENTFIMSAVQKSSTGGADLLQSFVDSTGQTARLTTYMRDVKIDRMEEIEKDVQQAITKEFPDERYNVFMTGKALLFLKGTKYLVKNLLLSLALAIGLISLFMAYLFRSFRMVIISLVPNLLPLVITAGLMGYLGVPIKPSTILVFSIAFGISVDDTIHFLAKYRQELTANRWHIKRSVYAALRETGVSMFYTSIVLFFGFSVFIISSFGGTKALGGLVSATLLFAMLSNLILLPSLLLSLERSIANKQVLKKPQIDILPQDEDNPKEKQCLQQT